jgi:hypothetical protein
MNTEPKHSMTFETASGVEVTLSGYNLENLQAYADTLNRD